MPDFATLQQIDQGQPAGAIAAAAAAPTMAASYPMVAPHAAPDGSGSMTNLSDGDYLKFKAGIAPPAAPVAPATGLAKFQAADSASDAALKSGGKPASPPQGANGKPALTDVISNIGAAGNEALAAAAGAPVDLTTGALNLISRGTSALTGGAVNLGKISNPVAGSDWWKSALGILGADPRNVVAPDVGTQLLRSGVGGAVSAVLPLGEAGKLEEAASPVLSALGKALGSAPAVPTAIAGATGGVAGQVAQDVVPEGPLKPLAVTAAQLAGGAAAAAPMALAGGAARAGVSAAERAASGLGAGKAAPILDESGAPIAGTEGQPVTATPALANRVAQSIAARAGMSPGELADSIPSGSAASIVPGSVPTVGQATGNLGVLQAERGLVTASPGARQLFADRRVAQNTAQTEALKGMAPADAQAHAAGSYFVNRLNQIDATEQQAVAAARAHYGTTEGAVGGQGTTAEIGKALAAPIRARYGAAAAEADRAIAAQQAKVGAAADEAGGNATGAAGVTARQQYGKTLQDEIASIKAAANAERRALYDARDPDGTLAQGTGPIRQAARELHAELRPAAGDKFGAYESEWIDAARNLPAVAPRADLMALRQNVNGALSEAVNGQRAGVIGAANAVRRLTVLKNAMDEAEVEATQRAAAGEGQHVVAGTLAPAQTVTGRLAEYAASADAETAQGYAAAGAGNKGSAGPVSGGAAGVPPGPHGAGGPAGGGLGSAEGPQGVQGSTPLTENLTAEDVARARAADAFNAEYMQRFGPKTLAGKASAKQFGDFVEPASTVPGLFWRKGPLGAESTQQLIATMGSREAAEKAIGDYAAFDLKAAASGPDGLTTKKLTQWLSDHNDALNSFPALRDRFGTLAKAQGQLDTLQAQRAALEEANPIKRGQTGADSISQFIKAGPKGGEAIDQYLKQAGATPEATAAATDALAHTLRLEAMKGGDLTAQAFDRWRGRYSGALERLPDAAKQFDSLGNAQKAVEGAEARAMQTRADFLKGVGRFYLTKGGDAINPTDAISSVLGSPTAPASAASLMREAAGDANAVKGIRLNLADWISGKVTNTAEAGTSGDLELSNAKLQKLTANPDVMRAIETIDPKQAETLRAVAADAQRGNRSVTATKIPGSPASAADAVAAREPPEHEIAGVLGAETIAHAISHVAGLGPLLSIVAKGGAIAGRVYYRAARAARIQTERDLMTQALLNPDLARALLSAARAPKITPSMGERLHGTLAALTTSAATMPVQEKR